MRTAKCRWCSRADVPVSNEGRLGNHVDGGGRKCFAVGMQVQTSERTPPKAGKHVTQRNQRRRKSAGQE